MGKILVCGGSAKGRSFLATSLACTFVIHNTRPELPTCYANLANEPSWAQRNKGKISKQQRRK